MPKYVPLEWERLRVLAVHSSSVVVFLFTYSSPFYNNNVCPSIYTLHISNLFYLYVNYLTMLIFKIKLKYR